MDFEESLKGQYCAVTYNNQSYNGIIHNVDDCEIKVTVNKGDGIITSGHTPLVWDWEIRNFDPTSQVGGTSPP